MRLTEWKRGRRVGQNCTALPPGQSSSSLKQQAPCTPSPSSPTTLPQRCLHPEVAERRHPPGRVVSLTLAWGRYKVLGQGHGNFENQQIKVQSAHTCVPSALQSTLWPTFPS